MATLSGLHAKTGQNLQLDAGLLLWGINTSQDLATLAAGPQGHENAEKFSQLITSKTLGATKGGTTFTAVPEMRNLLDGVNGSRGNYKDGAVIDTWEISLKTTVSEMTAANIGYAIANSESPKSESGFDKQTGTVGRVKKTNYLGNVAWLGTIKGKTAPIIILIKNALNVNGMTFTAEDKNTGSIELELKAHFELSKPEEVPFEIYTPKA